MFRVRRAEGSGPCEGEASLGESFAALLGAVLRFREQLRALNSPFAEDRRVRRAHRDRLSQFAAGMRLELAPSRLLAEVASLLADVAGANVVQLFVAESPSGPARLRAVRGQSDRLVGKAGAVACDHSFAEFTRQAREPVVSAGLPAETRFRLPAIARRLNLRSAVGIPFSRPDGTNGALLLYWQQERQVRVGDLHFAQSVAGVVRAILGYETAGRDLGRTLRGVIEQGPGQGLPWRPVDRSESAGLDPMESVIAELNPRDELWTGELAASPADDSRRRLLVSRIPGWWGAGVGEMSLLLQTDVSRLTWLEDQMAEAVARWCPSARGGQIGVAIVSLDGAIIRVNEAWRRRRQQSGCADGWTAGLQQPELHRTCSNPTCSLLFEDLRVGLRELAEGRRVVLDREYRCLSLGVERWVAVRIEGIASDPDGIPCAALSEWDVTTQHVAKEETQRREAGALAVLRSSVNAVLELNHRGVIESANPAADRLFGHPEGELVGRRFQQLFSPTERGAVDPSLYRSLSADLACLIGPERELAAIHASGTELPVSLAVIETVVGHHPTYTAVIRDLSEQKQAQKQIERLSYHDTVTGLPNRLLFRDRLDLALDQARRSHGLLAVLFLNIDRFKRVNESWGHEAGDRLLAAVARRIEQQIRAGDLVARWSADEYNVLLPRIRGPEEALAVANRICDALRTPIELDGKVVYTSVTVGLAVYPRDGLDSDSIVRHADMAMYRAKRRGADVGQPSTSDSRKAMAADLNLDAELHRAVERSEFVVHYQPEIELATGRIIGAEALVRWLHPRHGMLQPNVFIGLAERTGLIVPIGKQVLEQACRQLRDWQPVAASPLKVSVNLSPRQLMDPRLIHGVAGAINSAGIEPGQLTLEVTETITINSAARRVRALEDLKMLGVGMALDDFGKGYSSLTRLRRLPVDTLKIDRTFVRRIRRDMRDAAIVRAIIQMGHSFGLSIVAEGVTSPKEAEFLLEQGCEAAQGYLYSPPVASSEFERFLVTGIQIEKAA